VRTRRADSAIAKRAGVSPALSPTITGDRREVEARSLLAFALVIGQHFITAEHEEFTRTQALDLAADFLTTPPAAKPGSSRGGRRDQ
jgi:hypothetical protein